MISSLYSLLCFNFSTVKEKCLSWHKLVEVIDPEKEAEYYFNQVYSKYESCRLKPLISFHNSSTGKWHLVNLTGNQFLILNARVHSSIQVKVCWIIVKLLWSIGYYYLILQLWIEANYFIVTFLNAVTYCYETPIYISYKKIS